MTGTGREASMREGVTTVGSGEVELSFKPLTSQRFDDFEALFGPRGACAGCWCMWWRLSRAQFEKQKGDGNRDAMRALVAAGTVPGIIAYEDREPVGWCSVAKRAEFPSLGRSRVLAAVDDAPVWSIVCFFVRRSHRRRGLMTALVKAAAIHAGAQGARIVEGYPVEPRKGATADAFAWTGLLQAFIRAGFVEVARRSPTRPIVRLVLAP